MNLSRIQLVSNLTLARFEHEFRQSQYFTFCFKVMIEWRVFFHAVRWKTVTVINGRRQDCRANGLGVKLHDKTKTRKHSCLCHIPHMMIYLYSNKRYESHPEEIEHIAEWCKGHYNSLFWASPQLRRSDTTLSDQMQGTLTETPSHMSLTPKSSNTSHLPAKNRVSYMCITPKRSITSHRSAGKSLIETLAVGWGFEPTTSIIGSFALTNWATELLVISVEKNFYIFLIWRKPTIVLNCWFGEIWPQAGPGMFCT